MPDGPPDPLIVLSTFPSPEQAAEVARVLVDEALAACVNLVPAIRSIYRWEGKVEDATETLAIIKTTRPGYDALAQRLVELHPYDVPEVLALPLVGGHYDYIEWIGQSVKVPVPRREVVMHVLDARYCDPMVLVGTTAEQRESESTYSQRFELFSWEPLPDTVFMKATGLDLGVFCEDLPTGALEMVDARHTRPMLEPALAENLAATIAALAAEDPDAREAITRALGSGRWTDASGAVVQAAGFARRLLEAVRIAEPEGRAVVWEIAHTRA
jgi:periplasmic divalent cation tolerance protein